MPGVLLQRFDLIRDFPGQGHVQSSYMPVGRQLLIKTALAQRRESTQPELSHDTGETEVKMLLDQGRDGSIRDDACTKGLELHTDRVCEANRVTQLHFTFSRQPRRNDIFGGVPGHIGADSVDTCGVLAAQRCAAVPGIFTIGIDGVLPTSETRMYGGATQ